MLEGVYVHLYFVLKATSLCVCLPQDVQEYVNLVCSGFLANVSLVIQSCYDMFIRRHMTRYGGCSSFCCTILGLSDTHVVL